MKILATTTTGKFMEGVEYDLPDDEAKAAISAGIALPVVVGAKRREKALAKRYETR